METSILEDLGLSKGEIKAYLALLELGTTKVGSIIEKTGMASSAIHNSLNTLLEKGLISYIKKGKIKYYQAVTPKQLLAFLEDKKKNLMKILPELELKQKLVKEKQEAEIFEGIKGVTTMLNQTIEDTSEGDEFLFFAANVKDRNEEIQNFFLKYDAKRKDKGLKIQGLANKELKNLFETRKQLKVKYPDCPIPSNISICNNRISLFFWGDKPVGYMIESKQIADIFRNYFYEIWELE